MCRPVSPPSLLLLSILLLSLLPLTKQLESEYSFAVISDMHIGESEEQTQLAEEAVAKINSLIATKNIKFVIITGDVSNTALPEQFKEAKEILDKLKVAYLPIIGNHDQWSYNSTSKWEEKEPHGDEEFFRVFHPIITSFPASIGALTYNLNATWNPELNITSHFQNFQLILTDDQSGDWTIIYGLDWNTRAHAIRRLGYLGSMPGCRLHNFLGGTFQWLRSLLSLLSSNSSLSSSPYNNDNNINNNNGNNNNYNNINNKMEEVKGRNERVAQIIMMQHQPFELPLIVPGSIYAFGEEEKRQLRNLLSHFFPVEKYWGVIAGHMHIWWNSTAFPLLSSPSSSLSSSDRANFLRRFFYEKYFENDVSISVYKNEEEIWREEVINDENNEVNWQSFWQWETCACKRSAAFSVVSMVNSKIASITKHYGDSELHSNNKYLCGEKIPSADIASGDNNGDEFIVESLIHSLC